MILEVTYFNGISASSHHGSLAEIGDMLVVTDSTEKNQYSFKSKDFKTHVNGDEVILTFGDFVIIMSRRDHKSLKHLNQYSFESLIKIGLTSIAILYLIYFNHKFIISTLAEYLPNYLIDQGSENLHKTFEKKHCLSKQQDMIVRGIFLRLNKNKDEFYFYLIPSNDANAHALPGKIIVFHEPLLKELHSLEAFTGILAHELAHVEENHLKKKFVKELVMELGFSALFNSSSSSELLKFYMKGRYGQEEEKEADFLAMASLKSAGISSQGMIQFFGQRQKKEHRLSKYLGSTHPTYEDRVKIFSSVKENVKPMNSSDWEILNKGCSHKH
jgi:beta-barrel assembly-enhancing protease